MTARPRTLLVVAAALTRPDGRVLLQQRPPGKQHGGLWEFPGGKVEPGEGPEEALARELAEELGIAVDPAAPRPIAFASRPHGDRRLALLLFGLDEWRGAPRPLEAAGLAWTAVGEWPRYAMPDGDRALCAAAARWLAERGA